MKSIYFHLVGGASGDMLLSSLIHLGCPLSYLKKECTKLGLPFVVELETVKGAHHESKIIRFKETTEHRTDLRYLEIIRLIKTCRLAPEIKERALSVYKLLFDVEQKIHKAKGNDFRFHHLGELDAILEICGFFVALDYLKVKGVFVSEFPLGAPAPATIALLKGKKVRPVNVDFETITPTAVALLKNAQQCDEPFKFEKSSIAYGDCGRNDYLVAYLIDVKSEIEQDIIIKIETNIDDMNPQIFESIFEVLYEAGAKEVYVEQVVTKKSRPAFVLNVLCGTSDFSEIRKIIFSHTPTFGIRYRKYNRDKLPFTFIDKKTKLGSVSFRVAQAPFAKETPEYADCLKLARKHKISLFEVYKIIS